MVLRLRITISALPLRTDMLSAGIDVCLVPTTDMKQGEIGCHERATPLTLIGDLLAGPAVAAAHVWA